MMKTILLAVGAALALGTSLSAVAGPDWYVIEKARAAKQTEAKQAKAQAAMERDHAAMMKACREMMSQPK
ncbi:hypothetical protein C3Z06_09585 [Cupriavidus metallidurans]|nr:hypothetical protein C3Z06_09585 [Cupriavidus metallidurans]